jgi:hypothetical protein
MGHRDLRAIARAQSRATCCTLLCCVNLEFHQLLRNLLPALPNQVLAVAEEASPKTSSWARLSFILSTDEK